MSLAETAEVERTARLLRCQPGDLRFLSRFSADEVRALRLAVAEALHVDHRGTYSRLGAASRLLPLRVTVPLARRILPARVSAGVVASMPPEQAADMAARMPADYVADVATHLSPVPAAPVLTRLPVQVVVDAAAVLRAREDYATMAEVVAALSTEQVLAVVDTIDEPDVLVEVALRVTDEEALLRLTGVLPEERLQAMVRWASRRVRLWQEVIGLLGRVPAEQRRRLLSAVRAS
jgi:hypothetical protein